MSSGQIHIYYPRGFRLLRYGTMPVEQEKAHSVTTLEGHQVVYSNGDEEVAELYRQYRASEDTRTWAYTHRVLSCAKRLLPHLKSFVFFQGHNDRLHGHAYDFLLDVVKYIETGRAAMQPLTAFELIEDHPERNSAASNNRRAPVLSDPGPVLKDGLVQWVRHPNGIEHLVESLYVMFGPARAERVAVLPVRTLSERKLTKGWMKISGE